MPQAYSERVLSGALWSMRNGYALGSSEGLAAIGDHLRSASEGERDGLRALLRIGVHADVEVTDGAVTDGGSADRPRVSQAFCSALPVAYSRQGAGLWAPFAQLALEAAYEATLWAGVLNARRGASNIVLLTRLGGGAFGNSDSWIDAAMTRALTLARDFALDVRLVSYGAPPASMLRIEAAFG